MSKRTSPAPQRAMPVVGTAPFSPQPQQRHPFIALIGTLLVQTFASWVLTSPSVLAPAVAPLLGIGPESVGLFVGAAYLAAMIAGLYSGRIVAAFGAVRVSQMAMICCGIGALAGAAGLPAAFVIAALFVGIGYGVINPAASTLLARHSPPANQGLFFSMKQTGVPLGVALAGLSMPLGLALFGWKPSVVLMAATCLLLGVALLPLADRLEPDRHALRAASAESPARRSFWPQANLGQVWRDPHLRRLSLTSFTFAFTQLCFITFLVSYLKLELGYPLAVAAGVLAAVQVVSTLARIGWGHVADQWIAPARLLGLLGLAMALSCIAMGLLSRDSGAGWVWAATILCAATAVGWNGVFFAELARQAGPRELARLAGATQFLTFAGSMTGPVVFGELVRQGVGYGFAFLALALLPAMAGMAMLLAPDAQRSREV